MVVFQSTLPARGATYRVADERYSEEISIHAPRTGSDCAGRNGRTEQQDFNPRSPHGERPGPHSTNKNAISFQSTLPARGATQGRRRAREGLQISIHAPRTGSDRFLSVASSTTGAFQSTLPARGATRHQLPVFLPQTISIHAPRTGSDELGRHQQSIQRVYFNPRSPHGERPATDGRCTTIAKHFNPRSPHGERRRRNMAVRAYPEFQSTLPARGATVIGNAERKIQSAFQSTLPARGATTFPQSPRTSTINFNPRSPHGERLTRVQSAARADNFNPRSPHGERLAPTEMITQRGVFQSTLPARGATPS